MLSIYILTVCRIFDIHIISWKKNLCIPDEQTCTFVINVTTDNYSRSVDMKYTLNTF